MMRFATLLAVLGCVICACASAAGDAHPILLPTPKKVTWLDGRVSISTENKALARVIDATTGEKPAATGISQLNERLRSLGAVAIPSAPGAKAAGSEAVLWVGTQRDLSSHKALLGAHFSLPKEMCVPDGYVLRCVRTGKTDVVICAGFDARGCYYGLQTLIQLTSASNGTVSIPRVDITDWPTFRIRLVKVSPTNDEEESVNRWTKLLPRYKMNVLAAQFQPRGRYPGTWRDPDPRFLKNSETIASGARQTDSYDALMYYGPFGPKRGSLVDPDVTTGYVDKLLYWMSRGYTWIGIDYNDFFDHRSVTKEEIEKLGDLGDIMSKLTNEVYKQVRAKYPNVGFVSVPCNGHYKNATPETIKYCKSIPEDILVASTGPVKKATEYSDSITVESLNDWAGKTGRKPYLWDNCLYRQLDHYAPLIQRVYSFEGYLNRFPPNMAQLLAGPAIHLNGAAHRWWEPGVLTFLDYTWNPEAYDAKTSLRNARVLCWGNDGADAAENAQRLVYELYAYLHGVYTKKKTGTQEEASSKYAEFEKAVKKLADIIGDPVVSKELDTECLPQAKKVLNTVFSPKKPIDKQSPEAKP